MTKVYATTTCPYCNDTVNVIVKVREEPGTKTVQCDNYQCSKHFTIRYHARVTVDIQTDKLSDRMQPAAPDKPPMRHVFHRFSSGTGMFNPPDSLPDGQDEHEAGTMASMVATSSDNRPERIFTGSIRPDPDIRDAGNLHDPAAWVRLENLPTTMHTSWKWLRGDTGYGSRPLHKRLSDEEMLDTDRDEASSRSAGSGRNPFAANWTPAALTDEDSED